MIAYKIARKKEDGFYSLTDSQFSKKYEIGKTARAEHGPLMCYKDGQFAAEEFMVYQSLEHFHHLLEVEVELDTRAIGRDAVLFIARDYLTPEILQEFWYSETKGAGLRGLWPSHLFTLGENVLLCSAVTPIRELFL